MRGLSKPWPPGNVSRDERDARTWRQAEEQFLQDLQRAPAPGDFARSAYESLEKPKVRAVMYLEQGNLCVFCERRVVEGHPNPRIDHWRPLSDVPALALHWNNLHLSCANDATCDIRKGNNRLRADSSDEDLPWPVHCDYKRCVGFTSLGETYVRSDAPLNDSQRRALALALGNPHNDTVKDNGILNLNHPALVAARAAAIDSERSSLERHFKGKTATRQERMASAAALLTQRSLPQFVSIRVRWLEHSLGQAR